MASAWITAIGYDQRWRIDGDSTQKAEARYELRVGSDALDTDLSYKRHLGRAQYHYQRGPNRVTAGFMAGYISGQGAAVRAASRSAISRAARLEQA